MIETVRKKTKNVVDLNGETYMLALSHITFPAWI